MEKLDFFCEEDDIFELYQSEFFFVVMHTICKKSSVFDFGFKVSVGALNFFVSCG